MCDREIRLAADENYKEAEVNNHGWKFQSTTPNLKQ
jgi:hypothetical protein